MPESTKMAMNDKYSDKGKNSFELSETSVKLQINKAVYLYKSYFSEVFGRCILYLEQYKIVIFHNLFGYL